MFTKKDLRTGDLCVRRNGNVEMFISMFNGFVCRDHGFNRLDPFDELLKFDGDASLDIVKVYRPKNLCALRFDIHEGSDYLDLAFDRERDCKPRFDKEKWARDMESRYLHDVKAYRFQDPLTSHNRYTIILDTTSGKTGMAKCAPNDTPKRSLGIAIAYCRLRGIEIPKEIFEKEN